MAIIFAVGKDKWHSSDLRDFLRQAAVCSTANVRKLIGHFLGKSPVFRYALLRVVVVQTHANLLGGDVKLKRDGCIAFHGSKLVRILDDFLFAQFRLVLDLCRKANHALQLISPRLIRLKQGILDDTLRSLALLRVRDVLLVLKHKARERTVGSFNLGITLTLHVSLNLFNARLKAIELVANLIHVCHANNYGSALKDKIYSSCRLKFGLFETGHSIKLATFDICQKLETIIISDTKISPTHSIGKLDHSHPIFLRGLRRVGRERHEGVDHGRCFPAQGQRHRFNGRCLDYRQLAG